MDQQLKQLIASMRESQASIQANLVPMLEQLDEDVVLSHYPLEEQARLYVAAAFTLACSLFSLDKLQHRQANAARKSSAATNLVSGSSTTTTTDAQLQLKMERITDYIRKLKEITELEQQKKHVSQLETNAAPRKRERDEGDEVVEDQPPAKTAQVEAEGEESGDRQMFSLVSRTAGKLGTIVSRLLRHAQE